MDRQILRSGEAPRPARSPEPTDAEPTDAERASVWDQTAESLDDEMMSDLHDKVKSAIITELQRQAPGIYFWDQDDKELFDGGEIEMSKFQDGMGGTLELADKFDMNAVAAAVLRALDAK